ncbi:MAG: alpha/beta hydrolase-fold protein [Capnocytophaga sp.]|nr:alpha/beta hydrolase-fold protein [Capnocytophaga sp.]
MRKLYIILVAFLCISCKKSETPQSIDNGGTIDMTQSIPSTILGGNQSYTIYFPPSYASNTTKKYPVMYFLHGMNQDYTHWATYGNLKNTADKAINEGSPEMIIICPNGYNSMYYNTDQMRYEDFFITEFIPAIESKYRILSEKTNRHIAGLSMGGFGATYLGLKYSDKFASAYSMSGGFLYSAIPLIQSVLEGKTSDELANLPRYTMECGTEDSLVINSNDSLHQMFTQKGILHNYIRRNGYHDWTFWKECLPKALKFINP